MEKAFAIAIHGGAGTIDKKSMTASKRQQYGQALQQALEAGYAILQQGGGSVNAVETAVVELENCPFFNAGKGAVFNYDGVHEMDAAIMDGRSLAAGAVACVKGVKNPIQLARKVMETGKYVFLCGEGAMEFAREQQLPFGADDYFYSEMRYREWKKKHERISPQDHFGTVGAVALDQHGHLAAATSTGGITDKRYQRIGDSPVIGAGTYANDATCAVSCTGQGEQFIRAVVAYDISCLMEYRGLSLKQACDHVMAGHLKKTGGSGGWIVIDRNGQIEMPFNTEGMYRACYNADGLEEMKIFND